MNPSTGVLRGHSLLAVFAHPDDESLACGGLLAWCAELGARVSILCATRGEMGRGHGGRLQPARRASGIDLALVRTNELQAAAGALGVSDVRVLDYEDGMLPWADTATLEADIRDATIRVCADVVITFGEDGLYWHPDHVAIHERTTAAIAALGDAAPALYYVTMAPGGMRAVIDSISARIPASGALYSILGVADADAFGAAAAPPTLTIDVRACAARKLAALRCHRSQLAGDALDLLSDEEARRLLGVEYFRRADVGSRDDAFIERLAACSGAGSAPHE
jgi:N-acetyl-1-D-myo-inositol-2-amino-2-deoxy-alpha-D-glucopyranoside deacetylase